MSVGSVGLAVDLWVSLTLIWIGVIVLAFIYKMIIRAVSMRQGRIFADLIQKCQNIFKRVGASIKRNIGVFK